MLDIWNKKNEMAELVYNKDNFKIFRNTDFDGLGYCVIYCSSNDIWSPNEEYAFRNSFIVNDKYEWLNSRFIKAEKEIFLRDIYKSWYVKGINKRIDSIEKLIIFLKNEVNNLKLIIIGSSAGGYLATLLGVKLKAERVICFSPQFELCNKWAMNVNPLLKKYKNDEVRSKYYNLKELINYTDVPIFNIEPIKSEVDVYHYNIVKEMKNIRTFRFNSSYHGIVMYKCNLSKFLNMDIKTLDLLYKKYENNIISPLFFSIELCGIKSTLKNIFSEIFRLIKKIIIRFIYDLRRKLWSH